MAGLKKRTTKRWRFLVWEALSKLKRKDCVCMRCKKTKEPKNLHAHHLIPKSRGSYARFCKDNIICLCFYCHKMWWHGQATWKERRELIKDWIGLERYEEIEIESNKGIKYTEDDYVRMLDEFKKELEE